MTTISRSNDSLPIDSGESPNVDEAATTPSPTSPRTCDDALAELTSQLAVFKESVVRELEVAVDVAADSGAGREGEAAFRSSVQAGLDALSLLSEKLQRLGEERSLLPNIPRVLGRGSIIGVEIHDGVQEFWQACDSSAWAKFPVCANLLGRISFAIQAAEEDADLLIERKLRNIVLEPFPFAQFDTTAELRPVKEVREEIFQRLEILYPPNNPVTKEQTFVTKAVGQGSLAIGVVADLIETAAYAGSRDAVFDDFVLHTFPMERIYQESKRRALTEAPESLVTDIRKLFDRIDSEYAARKEKLRELLRGEAI